MKIFESLAKRHSAYNIDKKSSLTNDEVVKLVQDAALLTPSSFNSQSPRMVVLFGDENEKFWDITREELRKVAPAEGFERTVQKLENFKGQGTILFYTDEATVKDLEEKFPLYAHNFPLWAMHENGMLQLVIWSALAENGIGASLQHYNPVVDAAVVEEFGVDPSWKLIAQMPFGADLGEKTEKDKLPIETRVIVKG